MAALLEVRDLCKNFGGLTAVDHLSFDVQPGEIVSLIGPNGAGKTTVFNLITGVYLPPAGDIVFQGRSIRGLKPDAIVRLGIARTFQTLRLFTNLSVLDNVMASQHHKLNLLHVPGAILRTPGYRAWERQARERAIEKMKFFGQRLMGYRFDQPANALSFANRRRLEMA
ncbi:MAG: ABC transporter ATP-binding protein, partial [Deinococcus sp.]|nr:ABC transporter ATP-binding protein [Deinococcus sp.]